MNKGIFSRLLPHIAAIVIFLIVSLIYNSPALQGMVLQQHDIIQWKAMSKSSFDFKEAYGHFPLWVTHLFSGMPGYQIAMEGNVLLPPQALYHVLTLFLPQPISLFFLACVCFYFLALALRVNPWIAIAGALTYAYATYHPIIIAAGHVTKMQSLAVLPAIFAALLVLFDHRKYVLGLALTAIASSLLIGMNHPQIAYYGGIAIAFMTVAYMISWIRKGEVKHLALSLALALTGGALGVVSNAVPLFTTYEYAKKTIRGGSELADKDSNFTKEGLSEDYAFSYSMKKPEPLVMMVPQLYGGSSEPVEAKKEDSKTMEVLQSMPPEVANQLAGARTAYWGGIGYTSGPPYVGAIVCFLALLGFVLLDGRHKWWILGAIILTIMMSWGSYLEGFNRFLLNTLPFYNKFRAPSMIIVVPTLLLNMMAMLTLQRLVFQREKISIADYKKGLLPAGIALFVVLVFYFTADFMGEQEAAMMAQMSQLPAQLQAYLEQFLSALRDDRKAILFSSFLRTFFFMASAALAIFLLLKNSLKGWWAIGIIGFLAFVDLVVVDTRYLSKEQYTDEYDYQNNFVASPADQQILQDKSYYRVFDVRPGLGVALGMQGAMPSYFHRSVGGYHPAKLSIYQDLIEHQLMKFPQSMPVFNMLNTKYIIKKNEAGDDQVIPNPDALGAAWFVNNLQFETSATAVMKALDNFNPAETAVLFANDRGVAKEVQPAAGDTIMLEKALNDEMVYKSRSANGGFAVFSEIFYDKGWKAYVGNQEVPIVRTNYVLRGINIPAGEHQVRFEFHPESFYTGQTMASIANIIIWLALLMAAFVIYRRQKAGAVHG